METESLRALAFFDAIGYPPTGPELAADGGGVESLSRVHRGRVVFQGKEDLIEEQERREAFFPRKMRKARRVARFLSRLPGVRFVAVCNTTALAHARDEGDLDFFVIVRAGSLTLARAMATVWYALLGSRPGVRHTDRDAVCLSFWVDDSALDLTPLQLPSDITLHASRFTLLHDDPYFRHWFLSLLPLYDDGISVEFWEKNATIRSQHPFTERWIPSPDLRVKRPFLRFPRLAFLDPVVRRLQEWTLSSSLKKMRNIDTRVVITPHVLKFHVEDGRAKYRDVYRENCKKYGLGS